MKTVIARFAPIPARQPVTPRGKEIGIRPEPFNGCAAEVMIVSHPLNSAFVAWCKTQPTKRKAREFCRLMRKAA